MVWITCPSDHQPLGHINRRLGIFTMEHRKRGVSVPYAGDFNVRCDCGTIVRVHVGQPAVTARFVEDSEVNQQHLRQIKNGAPAV